MNIIYDCEVYAHDWVVVLKVVETQRFYVLHNDNAGLRGCIAKLDYYYGFNSKHYDQYIIKAICSDFSTEEVKALSDYLIADNQGWQYPQLQGVYFDFNNVDLRDDTQKGLSLKAIEGHMGLEIKETDVDFNIDRRLTEDELKLVVEYCKKDVNATEQLFYLRRDYLKNKVNLGKLANLPPAKALSMTNAKLTAAMLQAVPTPHNDEREYKYPNNLLYDYIPQDVFDFFNRLYDKNVSDEECFKSKYTIMIGECPVTLGFGGIHGAIPNYFWDEIDYKNEVIRNKDVGSYYPHLCTINGYTSRNIPSPKIYADVLNRRMEAKAKGDTATANALKLVCNTTYGCLLNQYNPLYDPLMGRSVCITGQLYLLELARHCYLAIKGLKIVQLNTDGIMVNCPAESLAELDKICNEWQHRTGFELETDNIIRIAQKDVNNYIEVQEGGKAKAKGGYLVKGVAPAGAFNINNSCCIVATALKEYFTNAVPVEDTIHNCTDPFQFQIIAKAGNKYKEAYRLVDGEKRSVQKVNRVYATANPRYGKIYKVKAEDDTEAKIDSLPEHCIIDNENHITIDEIDKSFYIDMAIKRINDFKGIKPEKTRRSKMPTVKTQNVYQKLIEAREKFLTAAVNQSGKNMQLSFKYFELEDIVPSITRIYKELGLLAVTNFTDSVASLKVINTDNPEEVVEFTAPFNQIQPIVSNAGKQVTNDMQALGASITYMRRYLYQIAMDICVNDEIEPTIDRSTNSSSLPVATVPYKEGKSSVPTPEQREQIRVSLTAPTEPANELQIKGLKSVLKKLRAKDPAEEEYIQSIVLKTDAFKSLTKIDCEKYIEEVTAKLGE